MSKRSSSSKLFFYDLHGEGSELQVMDHVSKSGLDESEFAKFHSSVKRGEIIGVIGFQSSFFVVYEFLGCFHVYVLLYCLVQFLESLSSLTFLTHLNLSFHNFSGQIPSSTQLQSFDTSSYAGNYKLCGLPLKNRSASGVEPSTRYEERNAGNGFEMNWFYVSMALGFVTGF
ncbi:hypothetical protein PTKIN_Ptkin09bG0276200 [Pterospermum kingtungense]